MSIRAPVDMQNTGRSPHATGGRRGDENSMTDLNGTDRFLQPTIHNSGCFTSCRYGLDDLADGPRVRPWRRRQRPVPAFSPRPFFAYFQ